MKMRMAVLAMACAGLVACAPKVKDTAAEAQKLKSALDDITTQIIRHSPEMATSLGLTEQQAGYKFSDKLSDYSDAEQQAQIKLAQDAAQRMRTLDVAALAPGDAISVDVVETAMDDSAAGGQFGYGSYGLRPPQPYVVTQIDGAYTAVPDFLDSQHQLNTAQDGEDYLARLKAYAVVLDQETARIEADADKGVIPPDFVLDGALKQLSAFAAKKPADTVLVQSLKRRGPQIAGATKKTTADLVARATAIAKDEVLPAYQRQIAALKAIRPKAVHDAGVWRLPNGDKLYAAALRAWTTSDMTPDQIHQMGQDLVKDLDAQMDAILKAQGMTKGTLAERLQTLWHRKDQIYPNNDSGRAKALNDLNGQITALQPLLPHYFGVLAKAKLEIKRVPPYIEAGAPGGYYQSGALDGSRPGAYYINMRDTREIPRWTLPTITYHEGEPGHHWQISIAQESTGLPLIRSAILGFSGYQEGWGLYAEQLADEMGVYKDNPLGRLGYLQSMAFRAARLVVDTGMHSKHWSREQAIDFMVAATGMERSGVVTEIERYAVWPGQACAYMVGRQTINKLRDEAKAQLGDKFDIKAFHDVVLTNGAMPLSTLERVVRAWIAARKTGA
jgi:uncharacterized protein (DUF885 family)